MSLRTTIPCLLLAITSTTSAGDWPSWRGQKGDGVSTETGVPISWSPNENIAWKTSLPGGGRSSPIVIGDYVVITLADVFDQTRRVLAIDASSGVVRWNTVVHRGETGDMHKFNTAASSTPACDGQRIFAVFVDDRAMQVVALDLEGRILWSKSPGTFHSQHGFAASPVVFGNGVIINGQQDGEAFVVLLNTMTGDEIWRYKPSINLRSFSTPLLTQHDGELQLILTGASQTVALNPATGEPIWSIAGPAEKFVSTPSVGHGMVFSFGGSPEKKAMAVKLGGRGEISEEFVAWRNERQMPYVPTPILLGDYLHILSDTGVYTCLDPRTGRSLMTARRTGPVYSSPVAAEDRIYFFEDSGTCTVIANGKTFEVLSKNGLGEGVYSTPAIAHRSLFVRTEGHLLRIGKEFGTAVSVAP
ncbi:Outer membrane protein assembly factor BamB precursor [Caulifigura coniformis]|uniref:Outer membrane protein assembly factor BamB n=1 Tax=Caulifigura coniformis TaxID=2527983 RepID=A0A517SA82_9PLAN|nr:PQQ-binding-like beta-propeller repeat protein [Caulifigura coniformis]QDT53055.1 Outer membrane protein assembly factor BamB precursor [Caulifigura coniformis]